FAGFYVAFVQVQVLGLNIVAVLNNNVIAIGIGITRVNHSAIARGPNRSAAIGSVICAPVRPHGYVDRVQAAWVKVGADATEVQRRLQKGFTHALAFGSVVVALVVAIGVAYSPVLATLIGKLCCQNGAGTNLFAVEKFLFKQY